jgi:hypothetical protein
MQIVKLLPHQSWYIQAPFLCPEVTTFMLVCGYGAGKTRGNVLAVLSAVKRLQGKKDRAGDYARLIVAGYTLSHLNKTFLIYFRQLLNNSGTPYTENKKDNFFVIGTVTVLIIPMEDPKTIFGMESWGIFVEEIDELTEDKAVEAVQALIERRRQVIPGERGPFMCLASTAQGQKGLYRIYTHFKKVGIGFVLIRGRTEDNVYLPKAQIGDMYRMYTPEEREVFMHARFIAIAKGRVIPDFDWGRNYIDEDLDTRLAAGERVIIGQDFNVGFSRASAAVVRNGVVYVIKRYDFPNIQDAPAVFRHDFWDQELFWAPDATMKDSFPAFSKELRKYGIHIVYRRKNPLVEDTVFLLNKLLYTSRMLFCPLAKDAAEACSLAFRDKDGKVPKGTGKGSPIHDLDTLRYIAMFVVARYAEFADFRRLVVDKFASLRGDHDPVKRIGGGYTQIDPAHYGRKPGVN